MGINKQWHSTLSFRKFREKTFELSRIYWIQQMGSDCLKDTLATKPQTDYAVKSINASFDFKMHPQTVAETLGWLPVFMERNRLHLLVIYTAFLETYLKDIAFFYTASLGHVSNEIDTSTPLKLSVVGDALAKPIIQSSTVPDMIKYAGQYFDIDFGNNAREWIKIYKIRCAAAHNGGVATPKFLEGISGMPLALNPKENEKIGLTWDELRNAMKYGDDIVATIDYKLSNYKIKTLETEQVLREAKAKNKLPKQHKIWDFLGKDFKIISIKRSEKNDIINRFYTKK